MHEIAHLRVWNAYGRKAAPHGIEWKTTFGEMLVELEQECTWPEEYRLAILHARHPKSAVGGDPRLQKAILLDSDSAFTLLADVNIETVFFFEAVSLKN